MSGRSEAPLIAGSSGRGVRVRVVKAEGADAAKLISGKMLSLGSRVNPLPSPRAREVELHDRTGLGARAIFVGGVQPILSRTVRMSERLGVDAAKLSFR